MTLFPNKNGGKLGAVKRHLGVGRAFLALGLLGVSAWVAWACSSSEKLGGPGASCLLFTDCATNLVCAPNGAGTSMECTADAAGLIQTEDATAVVTSEAGAVASPDASGEGAAPTADDASASDDVAAPVEASSPAAVDAGEET